ncbi:EAL domain-containing protein [Vibrio chagasii]|nr:EAL domain-containing protein [Vibrio chagasii]CAH7062581.1 EAL domain-containing protein [Vibrio chagasii]CAH7078982.1 EAL domain-containing protein [Vibrio chagasii]CAH7196159.1 EAL domain-containing protein [Vibrio chagasii]CAH7220617.1 EAL domain-containing protein [Vibrio chagasii]
MKTLTEQAPVRMLVREIQQQAFYPVFQPIIDAESNTGVEVLVRWDNGHHVEDSIQCLTEHRHIAWFTRQLCQTVARELVAQSVELAFISVNVVPSHMVQLTFIRDIYPLWQACEKLGITLWLELTEGEAYPKGLEEKRLASQLGVCRGMGIKIVLDDYGRGYNVGEDLLNVIKPSVLKIDRSMMKNRRKNSRFWERIRFLSRKHQIKLLSEGIENHEDLRFAKSQSTAYFQGYYLGKPGSLRKVLKNDLAL